MIRGSLLFECHQIKLPQQTQFIQTIALHTIGKWISQLIPPSYISRQASIDRLTSPRSLHGRELLSAIELTFSLFPSAHWSLQQNRLIASQHGADQCIGDRRSAGERGEISTDPMTSDWSASWSNDQPADQRADQVTSADHWQNFKQQLFRSSGMISALISPFRGTQSILDRLRACQRRRVLLLRLPININTYLCDHVMLS